MHRAPPRRQPRPPRGRSDPAERRAGGHARRRRRRVGGRRLPRCRGCVVRGRAARRTGGRAPRRAGPDRRRRAGEGRHDAVPPVGRRRTPARARPRVRVPGDPARRRDDRARDGAVPRPGARAAPRHRGAVPRREGRQPRHHRRSAGTHCLRRRGSRHGRGGGRSRAARAQRAAGARARGAGQRRVPLSVRVGSAREARVPCARPAVHVRYLRRQHVVRLRRGHR